MALRVLVVDDTATFRKVVSDVLAEAPEVEVVGVAHNGRMALARIQDLKPDLVTLDIEMPELDGLEVLKALRAQGSEVGAIMVSAFTARGSEMTIRALELGAFDFITKPSEGGYDQNREHIRARLLPLVRAFAQRRALRSVFQPTAAPASAVLPPAPPARPAGTGQLVSPSAGRPRPEMVLVGISTGGPNALAKLIPALPASLGVPVFIVQHMPALFTRTLAESLSRQSGLRVKEAEHNEQSLQNVVYIAPGGKQMKLAPGGQSGRPVILITDDPPENNCKPSADTLFRSAALHYPGKACAVIMTGMGADGTLGLRLIKRTGARVIAQDEATCVVFGMPKEAIAAGVVDIVLPLDAIAAEIRKTVQGILPPLGA